MSQNLPRIPSLRDLQAQARRRGLPEDGVLLAVDVNRQLLYRCGGESSPVSTAARGCDNRRDSLGTPAGWHRVAERIGPGAPAGQEFSSRRPTPLIVPPDAWNDDGGEDAILSRILWLEGLEDGINRGGDVDSHDRFIYLHGTNHEQRLGTPASRGCVRMGNQAIIKLADDIADRETWVWIGILESDEGLPPAMTIE